MLIIAGRTEVDPDDRDEAVAVMRGLLTRACEAPGCLDVAITVDSVDPTGTVLTGRRTAEQVDHLLRRLPPPSRPESSPCLTAKHSSRTTRSGSRRQQRLHTVTAG